MTPRRRVPTTVEQERSGARRTHRVTASPADDPITVIEDPEPAPTVPSLGRITWLAAYAVGLTTTAVEDERCMERLLAADPTVEELRAAHGLLTGWEAATATPDQRALRLVEDGIVRLQAPSRREQQQWVTEWST